MLRNILKTTKHQKLCRKLQQVIHNLDQQLSFRIIGAEANRKTLFTFIVNCITFYFIRKRE